MLTIPIGLVGIDFKFKFEYVNPVIPIGLVGNKDKKKRKLFLVFFFNFCF